jgi:eukaryotic-like serine/threonine-protein kinase
MAGGDEPVWRSDGRELYFIASDNTLMAVPVRAEGALEVGTPRALFNLGPRTGTLFWHSYDVTRDGQRFLVARSVGANSGPALTVVVNWTAALKK